MRINIYAEEITDRVEVIHKTVDGVAFEGVRFFLYMPVTVSARTGRRVRGPFFHREGDDDSSAVTFWGKPGVDMRHVLVAAISALARAKDAGER